jgi:hypothetical protein
MGTRNWNISMMSIGEYLGDLRAGMEASSTRIWGGIHRGVRLLELKYKPMGVPLLVLHSSNSPLPLSNQQKKKIKKSTYLRNKLSVVDMKILSSSTILLH